MEFSAQTSKHLGQLIREYRSLKGWTQEKLAEAIGVDERTIRMWEGGVVESIRRGNIDKIACELDMPRGLLGPHELLRLEDAKQLVHGIPKLLARGAYVSALNSCQQLQKIFRNSSKGEDVLSILVHAEYLMGNTVSIVAGNAEESLQYYKRMARHAKQLEKVDPLALVLARMSQAEMHRRLGHFRQAQDLLEDVEQQLLKMRHVEDGNIMLGNCYQWLARVYLAQGNILGVIASLDKAHEQAIQISGQKRPEDAWYSCFGELSVVEEAAKSYMLLRQYPKSLEYVKRAKCLVKTAAPRWRIPVILREAEVNLRASLDFPRPSAKGECKERSCCDEGVKLLLKGDALAREHHHYRLQQRVDWLLGEWERQPGVYMEVVHTVREGRARLIQPKEE